MRSVGAVGAGASALLAWGMRGWVSEREIVRVRHQQVSQGKQGKKAKGRIRQEAG